MDPFSPVNVSVRPLAGSEALTGQGKYTEAEQLLLPSVENLEQQAGATSAFGKGLVRDARGRLVQLYDAWEKPEEAAKWRARARTESPESPN